MAKKQRFKIGYHKIEKVLFIRSNNLGNRGPFGVVYKNQTYKEINVPSYINHVRVLALIPDEVVLLCNLMESSELAVNYLNANFPDLEITVN